MMEATPLGTKLREERKRQHLTQANVALKMGVTQQTVAAWENGKRPGGEHFDKLASFIGMDHDDFVLLLFRPDGSSHTELQAAIDALRIEMEVTRGELLAEIRRLLDAIAGGPATHASAG